jgi:hypothetical protein
MIRKFATDEADGADCWIAAGEDSGSADAGRKIPKTSGTSGNLLNDSGFIHLTINYF